jgi:hypothetical protein
MIVFHGTQLDILDLDNNRSRYGKSLIFATNSLQIASMFGRQRAYDWGKLSHNIFNLDIGNLEKTDLFIEYEGKNTYSSDFKKLVQDMIKTDAGIIKIKNVVDYPSRIFRHYELSDTYIITDFSRIKSIERRG